MPAREVSAGDLNADEARVVAAAGGTFTYEGKTYRAYRNYVNSLVSYLSDDDVDLTAAQADEVIAEMYDSIAEGIERGYLYEVTADTDASETATDEVGISEEAAVDETLSSEGDDETTEQDISIDTPTGTMDEEVTSSEKDASAQVREDERIAIDQPQTEEASGTIVYDEETDTIIYHDADTGRTFSLPSITFPPDTSYYNTLIQMILLIMTCIVLGLTMILILAKCFPWQKKKRSRAHSRYYVNYRRRRSIRLFVGHTFTVMLFASLFVSFLLLACRVSLFRDSFVEDHLISSGYYKYVYQVMTDEIEDDLSGLPEEAWETTSRVLTYDRFFTAAKEMTQKGLQGETAEYDTSALVEEMYDELSDTSLDTIEMADTIYCVMQAMTGYTADMVGGTIYAIRYAMNDMIQKNLWLLVTDIVLMAFVLVAMDRYHHRGVRYISRAWLTASAFIVLISGYLLLVRPYERLYMEPEYLFLFFTDYLTRGLFIIAAVGVLGILSGIFLRLLMKTLQQKKIEET